MRCFFNINGWQIIVMTNELVYYYNSDSSGLQDPATLSFFCWILKAICLISRRRRLKELLNVQSTIERPQGIERSSATIELAWRIERM